jgi:hypothetical protein
VKKEKDMTIFNKKIQTPAEIQWHKERQDERWEKRVEYLEWQFSKRSVILPRQIAYLNALASCKAV